MAVSFPLTHLSTLRALLKRHDFAIDKALGQHYLIDAKVLEDSLKSAELEADDYVLEVGPGPGVLTQALAQRVRQVTSIEFDKRVLPVLAESLAAANNVQVVHADAMDYDYTQLPDESLLVANLPYNIAAPLMVKLLESGKFKRLVFLIQREMALRLCANPGSEFYGALTLIVAHFARARLVRHVKPGSFYPPPEVMSSLVRLDVHHKEADSKSFQLVRQGFAHRRKTLKRNLLMAGYSKEVLSEAFRTLSLDEKVRAEALTLEQFKALSASL